MVSDQDKALKFYTEVLGFVKKTEIPMGQAKWLTVVSPEAPDEVELLLEPNDNPAAKTFQESIFKQGWAALTRLYRQGQGLLKRVSCGKEQHKHKLWRVGNDVEVSNVHKASPDHLRRSGPPSPAIPHDSRIDSQDLIAVEYS